MNIPGFQNLYPAKNVSVFKNTNTVAKCLNKYSFDTISFSGNSVKYADNDTQLLDGYSYNPITDIKDLSTDKLIMVHMTNFEPENGMIKSLRDVGKEKLGKYLPRSTVHFAINQVVGDHDLGTWSDMKYAILAPMEGVIKENGAEHLIGGQLNDFYVNKSVKLPKNTCIVKHNPNIQPGKLRIRTEDGINIIETSDNVKKTATNLISKMGYTNLYDYEKEFCNFSDEYLSYRYNLKKQCELLSSNWQKYDEIFSAVDDDLLEQFEADKKEGWNAFCKKSGFRNIINHNISNIGMSEHLIPCIFLVSLHNNSWTQELNEVDYVNYLDDSVSAEEAQMQAGIAQMISDGFVDYKKEFLAIIDKIAETPDKEPLSYDIFKLRAIIEESKTPKEAFERIEDELDITVQEGFSFTLKNAYSPHSIYNGINGLLSLSGLNKLASGVVTES